ncbi:hypothetical protein GOV13_05450 [Candidatus Pacearchaeota archaeon]|nr:hypothetical protein [Candidatus Pacearchaeota archaeon]
MRKINIQISNRALYTLMAMMFIVLVGIGVVAYGTSDPVVFGHSAGEIEGGGTPSGAIMMFDTSCPQDWTRFSELDGKVPRGNPTYVGSGGAETHSHGAGSHTHTYNTVIAHTHTSSHMSVIGANGASMAQGTGGQGWAMSTGAGHLTTSTGSSSGTTVGGTGNTGSSAMNSWPPYLNIVYCQKN